ncbi:efflux transporter outer membrane subunit [Xanthomonas axonopodis pv. vasculorum]|uniref:RND transporter n=1 Tax=Xanthomonas axonopodis pv. vasculorum TaxID=325777 RepID=A0A098PUN3_9XANT|nr:efflux transporter outer membrane subunit [Xanthomonas axonopodis]KGE50431.1 RND transporter [Xanthomonas axonopodis pv. vasculorum]PPV09217.1 RND transporter [Xanthomonas axonopodis pv. vasculorum]QKD88353.1 efflux transporter outer membrane subunit [Xanthomonas axonopodis pv. vasculorum]
MNRGAFRPLGLAALLMLSACSTVGPNYAVPDDAAYRRPAANAAFVDTGNDQVQPGAAPPARLWALYQYPMLDGLIKQALRDNVELKVAGANLRRAAAVYEQAMDAGGFDVEVEAGVSRAQVSAEAFLQEEKLPVFNLADGKLGVSYQFDLFGKLQRGAEAAHADTQVAQAAIDLARVSVAAQVAGSYVEICHANHELQVAEHSLQLQQHSRQITQRLIAAGRGTPPDLARATAQVAMLEASLPPLRAHRQAAGYQLAALLGKTPGEVPAGVDSCAHAPALQQPIPIGDGRALLARRPDVRQAERRLAAATVRIGVATAELYPDIRLGGSISATGLLADFGEPATHAWSLGPLISWTLPSSGARALVRATGADAALAQFENTVLQALREVQTTVSRYAQDLDRLHLLEQAQQQAELASSQNRRLYRGGRTPYLSSLDAERTLATADMTLATAQAQVSQDQIQLFLALGGGWDADAGRTDATAAR